MSTWKLWLKFIAITHQRKEKGIACSNVFKITHDLKDGMLDRRFKQSILKDFPKKKSSCTLKIQSVETFSQFYIVYAVIPKKAACFEMKLPRKARYAH